MMDEATISLLTGPTSSLVLLLGMSLGLWRFGTQTILPAVKRWVDQHLNQVDELLAQHKADREAWLDSMERKVGGLYKRHEALVAKLDGLPSVTVNGVPE
jgi:hypothetical protein